MLIIKEGHLKGVCSCFNFVMFSLLQLSAAQDYIAEDRWLYKPYTINISESWTGNLNFSCVYASLTQQREARLEIGQQLANLNQALRIII